MKVIVSNASKSANAIELFIKVMLKSILKISASVNTASHAPTAGNPRPTFSVDIPFVKRIGTRHEKPT